MGSVSDINQAHAAKQAKAVRRAYAAAGVTLQRPTADWNDGAHDSVEDLYIGEAMPREMLEEISELFDLPLTRGARRPSQIVTSITKPRTP